LNINVAASGPEGNSFTVGHFLPLRECEKT
jgi:hypothetical protein